jgi:hypothetical protein
MKPGFEFTQKIVSNRVELRGNKEVRVPVTITYKVKNEHGILHVTAWDPKGKHIGRAGFWKHQTRSGLESLNTDVDDDWQGLGIAANMYAVVRMLGANINPSLIQTKQGKNMWKKWRQQGDIAQLKSMNAKIKDPLKELFAPGGNDEDSNDPYQYPKPEHYARSIDFFGQFEAEHFDQEDMNDATGEFKGYWDYDGKLRQIAYFKFDNAKRTGSNHPGMGWYYEPQNEDVAGSSLNEFAPGGQGGGDSGRWYTDDELADIIGDDWFQDFDVSHNEFDIDAYGEKAKQNLVGYANAWFDDRGYNVNVLGVEHNDVDHDLKWYIVGSFHNPRFANEGVAEGSLEELTNTSLKVKQPKDFVNVNDRKQITWKVMKFKSGKDTYLINFTMQDPPAFGKKSKSNWNAVNVAFGVKEPQDDYSFGDEINTDLTARNKNQFLIYSTVINAVRKFITEYNTEIDEIIMQGAGERQQAMYQRFFQSAGKYFPGWHYDGKHSLVRDVPRQPVKKVREQGVAENFADGKKPGRKGLAKRVGVDCKQPISKLRSIASNSSGERQRMAHWCANMKSGKKK